MNVADVHCAECGLRRRDDWFRCPRCSEILPDAPVVAESQESHATAAKTRWAKVGGTILFFGAIAFFVGSDPSPVASQRVGASTVGPVRLPAAAESTPPVAPEGRLLHDAVNARITGGAAYARGNFDQARADYEAAVSANPEDAEARNNLAQVLMRQNLPSVALPHFDEAVRVDPGKWAFRFNRARAYAETNRLRDAADEYQAAAKLFPEDYATHYNLGLTQIKLKQYPEAVGALEQAVQLAPGEPSFLITLGTAYVATQNPARAKATFAQFLQQAPDDPEAPRVRELLSALDASNPGI